MAETNGKRIWALIQLITSSIKLFCCENSRVFPWFHWTWIGFTSLWKFLSVKKIFDGLLGRIFRFKCRSCHSWLKLDHEGFINSSNFLDQLFIFLHWRKKIILETTFSQILQKSSCQWNSYVWSLLPRKYWKQITRLN